MGNRSLSSYRQTFNSFAGTDMKVMFHDTLVGEIQGLSYTVTREKAPLYTMGNPNARAFSRGKRGIAGSLIFLTFDRDALISATRGSRVGRYLAWEEDVKRGVGPGSAAPAREDRYKGIQADGSVGTFVTRQDGAGSVVGNRVTTNKVMAFPQYADQIMPLTIVVYAANEYGHSARMKIHNVEIMNAGSGMSVDDITTDQSCTFVATEIEPWSDQFFVDADGTVVQLDPDVYEPGKRG